MKAVHTRYLNESKDTRHLNESKDDRLNELKSEERFNELKGDDRFNETKGEEIIHESIGDKTQIKVESDLKEQSEVPFDFEIKENDIDDFKEKMSDEKMNDRMENKKDDREDKDKMNEDDVNVKAKISPPKGKTIRRDAKQIYKGLNRLDHIKNTPLDRLFHDLATKLEGPLSDLSLSLLLARFSLPDRLSLVNELLGQLAQIQELSEKTKTDPNLIKISLHDIRTFSKLFNVLLVHGVYPVLSEFHVGVPIEKRNIKDFGSKKQIKIDRLDDKTFSAHRTLLRAVYDGLSRVFAVPSDVKDLLTKGTGLSDYITIAIALSSIPQIRDSEVEAELPRSLLLSDTYELYSTLTLLVQSKEPHFRALVLTTLKSLPFSRNDGLLGLVEFVLGMREAEEVNIDRFDHVASVVLAKPAHISPKEYFGNLGNQMYNLLVGINRPVVTACVCHVLEQIWLRNKAIIKDFFASILWAGFGTNETITVSESTLNNAINVLVSLTSNSIAPDLLSYLVSPLVIPLFSCYAFMKKSQKPVNVLQNILVSIVTILDEPILEKIAANVLWESDWAFAFGPNGLLCIKPVERSSENTVQNFLAALDNNIDAFVLLLENIDQEKVQRLFVALLRRWLQKGQSLEENPYIVLMDLRMLENITSKFAEVLARTPQEVLEIVHEFLKSKVEPTIEKPILQATSGDSDSDDEDDSDFSQQALPVVLELLSAILSENESLDNDSVSLLKSIQKQLANVPQSLNKAAQSLHERITFLLQKDRVVSAREMDEKTLKRAIASLNDPLVPIRAHGLHMLRTLVQNKSPVVESDFVVNLHLAQLSDAEPFIYLNVIKGIESMMDQNTLVLLLNLYTGHEEDIDTRLKIGEILLRHIQTQNELFAGNEAQIVLDSIISMVSVRSDKQDTRIRMSAMSLLGVCCNTNPIGFVDKIGDVLDIALAVLQLETKKDEAVMRRAATVLIHDLMLGAGKDFPKEYMKRVYEVVRYVEGSDNDPLVREQAKTITDLISQA